MTPIISDSAITTDPKWATGIALTVFTIIASITTFHLNGQSKLKGRTANQFNIFRTSLLVLWPSLVVSAISELFFPEIPSLSLIFGTAAIASLTVGVCSVPPYTASQRDVVVYSGLLMCLPLIWGSYFVSRIVELQAAKGRQMDNLIGLIDRQQTEIERNRIAIEHLIRNSQATTNAP